MFKILKSLSKSLGGGKPAAEAPPPSKAKAGSLLDKVNIVFIPALNADGHERSTPYSRPNQRGPKEMGWRNTAQNLNLNRDFMKAEAPEMQALLALINKYDPDFYIDLHVTDGLDYQYDVTYWFDGWDGLYADSPAIGKWLNEVYRPRADAALKTNGHVPGPMIFVRDEADLQKGGAAAFHRQLIVGGLASEYENEIRAWLDELA